MHKLLFAIPCLLAVLIWMGNPFASEAEPEGITAQAAQNDTLASEDSAGLTEREVDGLSAPHPAHLVRTAVEEIEAGESVSVERSKSPQIEGILFDPAGAPLPRQGFFCQLLKITADGDVPTPVQGEHWFAVRTDREGRFLLDQRGAEFRYQIHPQPMVTLEWTSIHPIGVMQWSAALSEIQVRTHAGSCVEGVVDGLGELEAVVTFKHEFERMRSFRIDPITGRFAAEHLAPGLYTVQVLPVGAMQPLHTLLKVRIDPGLRQDPRLDVITVEHRFRAIDVRALPPFDTVPLVVMVRLPGSKLFRTRAQEVGPGHARLLTDAAQVDLLVSAQGTCVTTHRAVRDSLEVHLAPLIPIELHVTPAPGRFLSHLLQVEATSQMGSLEADSTIEWVVALKKDPQDPSIWRGELNRTGPWQLRWKLAPERDPNDLTTFWKDPEWTAPPGLEAPLQAHPGATLVFETHLP